MRILSRLSLVVGLFALGLARAGGAGSTAQQHMREGDIWEIVVPAGLAYREPGVQDRIGPNETLI